MHASSMLCHCPVGGTRGSDARGPTQKKDEPTSFSTTHDLIPGAQSGRAQLHAKALRFSGPDRVDADHGREGSKGLTSQMSYCFLESLQQSPLLVQTSERFYYYQRPGLGPGLYK